MDQVRELEDRIGRLALIGGLTFIACVLAFTAGHPVIAAAFIALLVYVAARMAALDDELEDVKVDAHG